MPSADAIAMLEPSSHHRRLVEEHVLALTQRRSWDQSGPSSDSGGALSLDDLTVVHGLDRYSVPALVSLGPDLGPVGGFSSSSRVSTAALGSSSRSSLGASCFSSPDHELANTRVRFLGVTRSRAGGHCEFLVQVDTGKEQFLVRKRYSEFRDLRQQLLAALKARQHCRGGACEKLAQIEAVKFPHRKLRLGLKRRSMSAGGSGGDLDTARDRVLLLQRFVEAVLRVYRTAPKRQVRCCLNAQCKMLDDVRAFLDLTMPEGGALSLGDSVGPPADVDAIVPPPTASSPSLRDLEARTMAKSSGASLALERGSQDAATDAKDPAPATRRSQAAASARASLYTISEDLEALHVHA